MASNSFSATDTSLTALLLATATSRISNSTPGQRRFAFWTTSFSASLLRPQITPTFFGRKGSFFFRSGSKSPSAANLFFSASSLASRSPTPSFSTSTTLNEIEPFLVQYLGRAFTLTLAFCSRPRKVSKRLR